MASRNGRMSSTCYSKDYKTFEDGIVEILENFPRLKNLFFMNSTAAWRGHNQGWYYERIAELAASNTPNPSTRENMLWEFSIKYDRVYMKTNQFIAIEWRHKRIPSKAGNTISFHITVFGKSQEDIAILEKLGFTDEYNTVKKSYNKAESEETKVEGDNNDRETRETTETSTESNQFN